MKKFKTILALLVVLRLGLVSIPANITYIKAAEKTLTTEKVSINEDDYYEDDYEYDYDYDEKNEYDCIYKLYSLKVTPSKKVIKIGKSFYINVIVNEEEFENLRDEEFIEDISYRSSKSDVAKVKKNGKVIGLKKGSAVININISTTEGKTETFKTKVYVIK